jgi:hypothetical protein
MPLSGLRPTMPHYRQSPKIGRTVRCATNKSSPQVCETIQALNLGKAFPDTGQMPPRNQ